MQYPAMTIRTDKALQNAQKIVDLCGEAGIDVWGVTKGLAGDPRLARVYEEAGMKGICDSRLLNLERIKESGVQMPRQLIRIAMPSELRMLPRIADSSLQSEIKSILTLDSVCSSENINHEILLAFDAGDLREGFMPREIREIGWHLKGLKRARIAGVAVNFACASGLLPCESILNELVNNRNLLEDELEQPLPVISIGGTCCLKAIEEGWVPKGVNQLRICEAILSAWDTANQRWIDYLHDDVLTIFAEIVECRHKPTVPPPGEIGRNAFGESPVFVDRGMRKRALIGIGRQDIDIETIAPLQENVSIIGASSDHTIVDVNDADSMRPYEDGYKAGDVLSFRPLYPAMLAAATSEYVSVYFV